MIQKLHFCAAPHLLPMNILFKEVSILNRKVPLIVILWFALALIAALAELLHASINNYLIFKQSFWHTLAQTSLYQPYPAEYNDLYFYGPLFTLIIAPFSILPTWLGCTLWCMLNAGILYYAIWRIHLSRRNKIIILAITAIEMMTSIHNVQINPMIGAWIILAYVFTEEEKDLWATFIIAVSFLVKIYGIASLLFFVFSKHKVRFILSFIFWMIVLICLPMIYTSPSYILSVYQEWYHTLIAKNNINALGNAADEYRDISVMGMIRRMSGNRGIKNLSILIPAAVVIVAPLMQFKQSYSRYIRLSYLAIVLITVVIYSTGAESSTYVIPVAGVAIWYVINYKQQRKFCNVVLLLVFMLTILSATDLCPGYLKSHFIRPYSLKALPCFIVWCILIVNVFRQNFFLPRSVVIDDDVETKA
jgi:hypothetical protein